MIATTPRTTIQSDHHITFSSTDTTPETTTIESLTTPASTYSNLALFLAIKWTLSLPLLAVHLKKPKPQTFAISIKKLFGFGRFWEWQARALQHRKFNWSTSEIHPPRGPVLFSLIFCPFCTLKFTSNPDKYSSYVCVIRCLCSFSF